MTRDKKKTTQSSSFFFTFKLEPIDLEQWFQRRTTDDWQRLKYAEMTTSNDLITFSEILYIIHDFE